MKKSQGFVMFIPFTRYHVLQGLKEPFGYELTKCNADQMNNMNTILNFQFAYNT